MDNGHGRPRDGGRVHDRQRPWLPRNFLVSFLLLHFAKNVPWEQHSLPGKLSPPPKALVAGFNLDSLKCHGCQALSGIKTPLP